MFKNNHLKIKNSKILSQKLFLEVPYIKDQNRNKQLFEYNSVRIIMYKGTHIKFNKNINLVSNLVLHTDKYKFLSVYFCGSFSYVLYF